MTSRALLGTIALLALVFTLIGTPAEAASGYHASYFSESAFLTLAPGETGQFAVGFANTGDQPWVLGSPSQASLHTAVPLDNTADSAAGWATGWYAPNIYSRQSTPIVAPAEVGYFVYSVRVPIGSAAGAHSFYGRVAIDVSGFLEDYGYYQVVTVAPLAVGGSPALTRALLTASNQLLVTFSQAMTCTIDGAPASIATGTNYVITTAGGPAAGGQVVGAASADCTQATLTLSSPLATGADYNVRVTKVRSASGVDIGTPNEAPFKADVQPGVLEVSWNSATQITVRYSTPMRLAYGGAGSADNLTSYKTNDNAYGALCTDGAPATTTASNDLTRFSLSCLTSFGTWGGNGLNRLTVRNILSSNGIAIVPNPTTKIF